MKGFGLLLIIVSVFPAVHMTKIFVYGTLKKGQPNHSRMKDHANGQAEFVAHARTVDRYPLVIATKDNVPFLLNVPGSGQHVTGEIYSVDQQMLDYLDWFEECPLMYQRSRIRLEVQDGPGGGEHTPKTGSTDGPGGGEHTPKAGSTDGPGGGEHTPKAGSADGPGGGEHTPKAGSTDGPGGGEHTPKAGSADGPGGGEHTPKTGSSVEAFVYSTKTYEPEWLQKTTYESYDTNGDHGLRYVCNEDVCPE
ncbi:hypothetical protein R3I94_004803 [Phoxinus phoxinus]